ncbi:MAG: ABC transporter permease [Bacteroidaceae bacterium]|nr:ABC transporter permease [Bacteroidaceae bacterium]
MKYKFQTLVSVLALAVGMVTLAAMHFVLKHFGPPAIAEEPYYERTYVAELSNGQNNYAITKEDGTQEWMFVYTRITTEMHDALFSGGPLPGVEQVKHNAFLGSVTMGGSMTFSMPDGSERIGSYRYYVTQAEDLNFWGIRSALTGKKIPVLGDKEIVISEMHAREIFGDENPVGCSVSMSHNGEWKTFTIRDVYTSERIADGVTDGMYAYVEGAKDYIHFNYGFVLEEGVNPKDVEAEMTRRMKTLDPQFSARLTPLSKEIDEKTGHMSVTHTIVYLISSLILAAALIGFLKMQLQLFRMRQREVALRRVHGASRRSIFRLFACETLLTFLLAGIVAYVVATLLIDFANASLTPYLNDFGWHIEGVYESVAAILLAVVLISFFVVWLTVRTMMRQRQSMTMQLHRSRGHALRNTMLGIQIAICILFVGGSLALTQFSELALREMNVPENDDFYKECILVHPYVSDLDSPQLLEYLRTEAQGIERFIPMNHNYLQSKEIQEDTVVSEKWGSFFIQETVVGDTAIFDFLNISINWMLPPEERHDCILMSDSLYAMMERYGFNANGWFLPIDKEPLRIGGTFSTWPYTDNTSMWQQYKVVHLGNWRDEEVTEVIVQPKEGAYDGVFSDLTDALQRINPKPLEPCVTNLRDALDDNIFFIEIMRDASWILSGICLVICLMGIWSTIALDTRSRRKEVALRKIHGAKRGNIVLLFGRLYLWLIGVASVITIPVGILFNQFLKDWAKQEFISPHLLSPVMPLALSISITSIVILLVVSLHVRRVMKQKPAEIIAKE